MIQIIVLLEIYDKEAFHKFETNAIRIMKKYDGKVISAFEPNELESTSSNVDEVHFLEFPNMELFKNYRDDEELIEMKELRERGVSNTTIIVSGNFKTYE